MQAYFLVSPSSLHTFLCQIIFIAYSSVIKESNTDIPHSVERLRRNPLRDCTIVCIQPVCLCTGIHSIYDALKLQTMLKKQLCVYLHMHSKYAYARNCKLDPSSGIAGLKVNSLCYS